MTAMVMLGSVTSSVISLLIVSKASNDHSGDNPLTPDMDMDMLDTRRGGSQMEITVVA